MPHRTLVDYIVVRSYSYYGEGVQYTSSTIVYFKIEQLLSSPDRDIFGRKVPLSVKTHSSNNNRT